MDRETGQFKGWAHVTFPTIEMAQSAVRMLSGNHLKGREIHLDFHEDRGSGPRRPGGYGDHPAQVSTPHLTKITPVGKSWFFWLFGCFFTVGQVPAALVAIGTTLRRYEPPSPSPLWVFLGFLMYFY